MEPKTVAELTNEDFSNTPIVTAASENHVGETKEMVIFGSFGSFYFVENLALFCKETVARKKSDSLRFGIDWRNSKWVEDILQLRVTNISFRIISSLCKESKRVSMETFDNCSKCKII